ncbi:MAG: glutamate 5-kinase [Candidatus Bathyarchaeia archaeon]
MKLDIFNKVDKVVVKAGTSSLTDANSKIDMGKIGKLVSEIMRLKQMGKTPILVSSGAIGAGMGKLNISKRPELMRELQASAAIGQGLLMQTYEFFFNSYEQPIAQLLLTKDDFTYPARNRNLKNTLETLLKWDVIPIINENDSVATDEIKVGDNDTLAAYVAIGLDADLLIILTDVDGLYKRDENGVMEKEMVGIVEEVTSEVEGWASKEGKGFGGMYTKVQAAKLLAEEGIPTIVTNCAESNILVKIFEEPVGTLFLPRGT